MFRLHHERVLYYLVEPYINYKNKTDVRIKYS